MNKETANSQKHENWQKADKLRDIIKKEKEKLIAEQVEPLLKQAEKLRQKLEEEVNEKYKAEMDIINKKETELRLILDEIYKKESEDIWYPKGTLVYLWERPQYGYEKPYAKTGKTGIVHIYDGSQDFSANWRNRPSIGDLIVIHNLKSGKQGLKCDKISNYGTLAGWFPMWLADGDTPTDNILTRKEKHENL